MVSNNVMKNVQIINKIISIETGAQELIQNAKQNQTDLQTKVTAFLDERSGLYHEKTAARIEKVRAAEEEFAKERIGKIYSEHAERIGKLKKIADENIDSWTEALYSFIIKPTVISDNIL